MTAAAEIDALYSAVSPSYRLQKAGITIDGGVPLDFQKYPYLPHIIDSRHRRTTIIKGAQMGFTIAAILWVLELARAMSEGSLPFILRGIGYWFPTSGEAQSFSKSRFTPLMDQNQHYWNPSEIDVDSAELKRFGKVAIYLRGVGQRGGGVNKSTSAVKSIPLDVNALDEVDEMDPSRVDAVHHRLDASDNPMSMQLSTPTLPQWGVDLDYQKSDQTSWLWVCPKCNEDVCLEDAYPDCIAFPTNADPYYLCTKCRDPLERSFGRPVARRPEIVDHHGLWISQLCATKRSALDIVREEERARESGRMREFYNQVLARAYAEVDDQITAQQLADCLTQEPRPLAHEGPCAMGVDPGKIHWYEVRARVTDTDSIQVARGRADSYEELAKIAKRYNVESGVMDKGFDPSAVARFCEENRGWFGCLYVNKRSSDPDWNGKTREVKAGRTRLLDDAQNDILSKRIKFYQKDEFWEREFVPQMTNLKRTTIENATTGAREAMWVVTGGGKNDHLRHANAYAWLAMQRVGLAKTIETRRERARRASQPQRRNSAMVNY